MSRSDETVHISGIESIECRSITSENNSVRENEFPSTHFEIFQILFLLFLNETQMFFCVQIDSVQNDQILNK